MQIKPIMLIILIMLIKKLSKVATWATNLNLNIGHRTSR